MTRNEPKQAAATPAISVAGDTFEPTDAAWEGVLVCPTCGTGLTQVCEKVLCVPCRNEWPVVEGVPLFAEHSARHCEIPLESLSKVNSLIREKHWRAVMLESEDSLVRRAAETILNVDSANWHWLTGLSPQSKVLDVGAGLGTQSHALACRFREVVALEPVRERAKFMQRRFTQDGIRNVKILQASPWDIPLPPGSFDLIVLNGILPWLAAGREGDPRALQVAALKSALRLLAPGGYLYIGIENRMSWQSFVGAPDVHSGLPYVSVLPRPLANWYARRRGQAEGYRNYTYSAHGYRRILEAAGFTNAQVYVAIPCYSTPRLYLPLKENVFSYYHQNFEPLRSSLLATVANRVLSALGLLMYVQTSFAILARKEP